MVVYDMELFVLRFVAKTDFARRQPCWLWTGATSGGYGNMRWAGRNYRAHVLSYLMFVGDYSEPLINHLCENTWCVNPDHLEPANHKRNATYGSRRFCQLGHDLDVVGRRISGGCSVCNRILGPMYKARSKAYRES